MYADLYCLGRGNKNLIMKKIFALLLLIPVVLFVGKIVLENKYKKELDKLVFMASPYARVDYRDLDITFDGAIAISGIRVEVLESADTFQLDEIKLFSSDRMLLIKGAEVFADGTFPEMLRLDIKGFVYDPSWGVKVKPKRECRYIEEQVDYSKLGIAEARDNWVMYVDFADKANSVYRVSVDSDDMYSMDFQLKFDASQLSVNSMIQQETLPINEISIDTRIDENFAASYIDYCARKLGMSEKDYVANVIGSDEYMKILGVRLTDEAKQALQASVRGGVEAGLVAYPSSTLKSVESLKLYKPKDIVRMLNLSFAVDGEPVSALVKANEDEPSVQAQEEQASVKGDRKQEDNEGVQEQKVKSFKQIDLNDISKYVGQDVRVYRKGKSMIEGLFISFRGNKMQVEAIGIRGYMTLPIDIRGIEKVEVFME